MANGDARRRLDQLLAKYPDRDGPGEAHARLAAAVNAYSTVVALVEQSVHDPGEYHHSFHASTDDALAYHDLEQEEPTFWTVAALVGLHSGIRYETSTETVKRTTVVGRHGP